MLGLLHTLRPLQFISHNHNMKIVVTALLQSVSSIINVLFIMLLIWLMLAILGMSLLSKKMWKCNTELVYEFNKYECIGMGFNWVNSDSNFDNIVNALMTIFILGTKENWTKIMYEAMDANF